MPQLIKEVDGSWQLASDDGLEWKDSENWHSGDALVLQPDEEPTQEHASASAIAIVFPAFNDGRGLSIAVLLRTRYDYEGDIRAVGAVHEDILHYMVRCGFSSAEIPEDRDAETALELVKPYSDFYQQSVSDPVPQFRRASRGT